MKFLGKIIITISSFFAITSLINAQDFSDNWVPVAHSGKLIYVDLDGIESFKGDDLYVWTMEVYDEPIEMEQVKEEIYKVKTYYLINKKLLKYSLLDIIYYDKSDNVIKTFSYNNKSDLEEYKYNFPIIEGSQIDNVLQRCLREIDNAE